MTPTVPVIRIDIGHHFIKNGPVNGYARYSIIDDCGLFIPEPNAAEILVECRNCAVTRSVGGKLTGTGLDLYTSLAEAAYICFSKPAHAFRIWSDNPNSHITAQVALEWGLVDRSEREAMISVHSDVFKNFLGENTILSHTPIQA